MDTQTKNGTIVHEAIPLKQGLKLQSSIASNAFLSGSRGNSIKTRIETVIISFNLTFLYSVHEAIPLKQGLKHSSRYIHTNWKPGSRGNSIKTRIETVYRKLFIKQLEAGSRGNSIKTRIETLA